MTDSLPTLTAIEKRILRSVRWGPRDVRFDNPTMNALQTQRLVSSEIVTKGDRLSVNRRWSITERGIEAYRTQC